MAGRLDKLCRLFSSTVSRAWLCTCCKPCRFRNKLLSDKIRPTCLAFKNHFRLTSKTHAIPPVLWLLFRPLSQIIALLFGRTFRHWWLRLTPNERKEYVENVLRHRKRLIIGLGCVASLFILYYYTHIERSPFTNRKRFITITQQQYDTLNEINAKFMRTMLRPHMLPDHDYRVYNVQKVVRRLLAANKDIDFLKNHEWRVFVVDAPLVNAMVVPAGDIYVFTGMFPKITSDEEHIGIVLAHELSHVILEHGKETWSNEQLLNSFLFLLIAIIWACIPFAAAAVTHYLTNIAVNLLASFPRSRKLEYEADKFGLNLAAKACFDPREAYAFWTALMMKDKITSDIKLPDFIQTHPNHGNRAARLEPYIDEALMLRDQFNCPPLRRYDPRILAKVKKDMMDRQLALYGTLK